MPGLQAQALSAAVQLSDVEWLSAEIESLTDRRLRLLPSEWAEEKRVLPQGSSTQPGRWRNSVSPYLVEPMDCLSPDHPARKIAICKAAQIGATVGILENALGYWIDHAPGPTMFITADKELAEIRMTQFVEPMLHYAGLEKLITAGVPGSARTGNKVLFKEFPNGFLMAIGARNPGKLRSTPAQYMVVDELDGCPLKLGDEGTVLQLAEKRSDTYRATRKLLFLSTPLVLQTSQIYPLYIRGDQRRYYVPCPHCGEFQIIEWFGTDKDHRRKRFTWETTKSGRLREPTVAYICIHCEALCYNHDKITMLPGGEWRPTEETKEDGLFSYHIPAFLSPVGMYEWSGIVQKWLNCWDVDEDRVTDFEGYRSFKNLEEGWPFEERGESPKFERVIARKRSFYSSGEIPNSHIVKETGGPAVFLTAAADVHPKRIDMEVVAWARGRQSYAVECISIEGDVDDHHSADSPWSKVRDLIGQTWAADDGRHYGIQTTLVDAGFASDAVNGFVRDFPGGVFPIMGRQQKIKDAAFREFAEYNVERYGIQGYNIFTTLYKDRLAGWFRQEWKEGQPWQPVGMTNYPNDYTDSHFKQYEGEYKAEIHDRLTRAILGYEWKQRGSRANHWWDVRVYNMAAHDMVVLDRCQQMLGIYAIDYKAFYDHYTPQLIRNDTWAANELSWME